MQSWEFLVLREASVRETDRQVLSSVTSLLADIFELTGSFTAKHQERVLVFVTPPAGCGHHPQQESVWFSSVKS